jgi:glycosyltransferase involved in cell wall biosynthesis
MAKYPLVSIVIPTKNSGTFLENCLRSIKSQTYKKIEIIIVDGNSTDSTLQIAKKYHAEVYQFNPKLPSGKFDAPHRRNYGVKKAAGEFIFYADADYEFSPTVIEASVRACQKHNYSAIINPLDTFGVGIWADAKTLERRCYFGDDTVEAPRFFRKSAWDSVGGLDQDLGGGGDDWDIYLKLKDHGFTVGRIDAVVKNNEGNLKIMKLYKKAFMYGKDVTKYYRKRPTKAVKSYFPIRPGYIKHWRLFLKQPRVTAAFIFMRLVEYSGGAIGMLSTAFNPHD